MTPQSSVRWSYLWGAYSSLWSPVSCTAHDASGNCTHASDPCEGKGAGEVDVTLPIYSYALALVTLGIVVPAKVTVFCSTLTPPTTGP
ncbi:MAG: hypothetical protein ACRENE_31810 [Polyangiaceae bacterium]